jgi:hypothetical protein
LGDKKISKYLNQYRFVKNTHLKLRRNGNLYFFELFALNFAPFAPACRQAQRKYKVNAKHAEEIIMA